jgi:EAL and modified HD-GYP domain-containing signal transduction protein
MSTTYEATAPRARAVIGRQPIVDRDGSVYGYEVLHRPTRHGGTWPMDGDRMTAEVILNTLTLGLESLVGDKALFVNADRAVLTGDLAVTLPSHRIVIEVLETVDLDDEVVAGVRELARQGFTIALDDFVWRSGAEDLLDVVSIVKVDVAAASEEDVTELFARFGGRRALMLAEKVESADDVERAREQGFDLFQGYAVERPTLVPAHALAPTSVARSELAVAMLREDLDFRDIESTLRHEPELTAQLMHLASLGADWGLRRSVRTIREALVLLGTIRIRQWIALTMLSGHPTASVDGLAVAVTRARICELAAKRRRLPADEAFTVGLLSSLDLLLGCDAKDLASTMSLNDDLREAAFDHTGPLGLLVEEVVVYEARVRYGAPGEVDEVLDDLAAQAFRWALPFLRSLG